MAGPITVKPLGDRQQRYFGQFMAQAGDSEKRVSIPANANVVYGGDI